MWCVANGLISGNDGYLSPMQEVHREQFATIMMRAHQLIIAQLKRIDDEVMGDAMASQMSAQTKAMGDDAYVKLGAATIKPFDDFSALEKNGFAYTSKLSKTLESKQYEKVTVKVDTPYADSELLRDVCGITDITFAVYGQNIADVETPISIAGHTFGAKIKDVKASLSKLCTPKQTRSDGIDMLTYDLDDAGLVHLVLMFDAQDGLFAFGYRCDMTANTDNKVNINIKKDANDSITSVETSSKSNKATTSISVGSDYKDIITAFGRSNFLSCIADADSDRWEISYPIHSDMGDGVITFVGKCSGATTVSEINIEP